MASLDWTVRRRSEEASELPHRAMRFPISCDLSFRIPNGKRGICGVGQVVDVSSTGVLFTTDEVLSPGTLMEISIPWPVRLNRQCGLKLVAKTRVVRCEYGRVAAEIIGYQFRTRRSS
jgi:hypothetical protein